MDDVTTLMTSIELKREWHNQGRCRCLDPTKTLRIHGALIPPGYATVSVDKVCEGYDNVALDIPGGDGQL